MSEDLRCIFYGDDRDVPSTSLTYTCCQNRFFRSPLLSPLFFAPAAVEAAARRSLAWRNISACRRRRATRESTWSLAGTGGSGGGPVPYTGTTLAGCEVLLCMRRAATGRRVKSGRTRGARNASGSRVVAFMAGCGWGGKSPIGGLGIRRRCCYSIEWFPEVERNKKTRV